jgi:hypothetical protein
MALLKRQIPNHIRVDDQGHILWDSYVGNWTHYSYPNQGLNNDTVTATSTPGASFSLLFTGIQIVYGWSCCVVLMLWWK